MISLYLDQERPLSPACSPITPPSFPYRPGSSDMIDAHFGGLLTEKQAHRGTGKEFTIGGRSRVTIDMLPEVALLKIFDFYVHEPWIGTWHPLAHVCRKWRSIVLGSPRHLGLQLRCTASTPVRRTLDVWPPLPIVVSGNGLEWGADNIVAALEHNDRICQLHLRFTDSHMGKLWAAMQRPFPALTWLKFELRFYPETAPIVPASFLGGSAPGLQTLILDAISFPGLPKLLLSATDLVRLDISDIPHSGYISPEAMATCLSALSRLERLLFGFESPQSFPDRRNQRSPPLTRTVLPVLTKLAFKGVSEYLEDLVAWIDAPQLHNLVITFFHQLIFDTPQLAQFISRTPKLKAHDEARVVFSDWRVSVTLPQAFDGVLVFQISCIQLDWQLSSMAQVISSSFPQSLIPVVENLYIQSRSWQLNWKDDIENCQWLEFFHLFTGVNNLYVSSEFVPRIAPALQEFVGERATKLLPALETLFLETLPSGRVQESIGKFVAARQLSGHSIAVSHWDD